MERILWIDTETIGLRAGTNGIHQLACIAEVDGEVIGEFFSNVQPFRGQLLSKEAMELGGVSREILETYPEPREVHQKLKAFLDGVSISNRVEADMYKPAGYNVGFDLPFWSKFFRKCDDKTFFTYVTRNYFDVLSIMRKGRKAGHIQAENCKLATICKALKIEVDGDMHNALTDVKATRALALWAEEHLGKD